MKHRSIIAFVIIAAALSAAPQLTHDLLALKGAAGARLHRELLYAFLSLPTTEASMMPAARPTETLLASCTKGSPSAPAAKSVKSPRTVERPSVQRAMITDPGNDPIGGGGQVAGLRLGAAKAAALLPEIEVGSEVSMIVPPGSGPDPDALASLLASREELGQARVNAEGLRVAAVGVRFDAKGGEWQRSAEEAVRGLNEALPGAYEFRLQREGGKIKVLKFNRCGTCPAAPAPRAARVPRQIATSAPLPAVLVMPAPPVGE
jgi:hypothetical protein